MDFVPNHSSDEHEWFTKSLSMDPKYGDYYVWQNASSFNGSDPVPPNNWVSIFRGSAWTWRPEREQFYLHQFDPGQPDLNYRNPEVKQEMLDVLTFWMDQGCDGYRMDAVIQRYELDLSQVARIKQSAGFLQPAALFLAEVNPLGHISG